MINSKRQYRICTKCILDSNDYPGMVFDEEGVCDICHTHEHLHKHNVVKGTEGEQELQRIIDKIKKAGSGKKYDCILGISGGVDSSYLACIMKNKGLRPLVVHVDGCWNSELSVRNIENVIKELSLDLYTYVIKWEELKDIQLAFLKASVIDIDLPFDNIFMAVLYKTAIKYNVKYIVSGHNFSTEGYLPPNFTHNKLDTINMKHIHKLFGTLKKRTYPVMGPLTLLYYTCLKKIRFVTPLNYIDYNKQAAEKFLIEKLNWKKYTGKHNENIFTRFYQGYILPEKFGIDKRKGHLTSLICSGQISRDDALKVISFPAYPDAASLNNDKEFFIKKFGLSPEEFSGILELPIKQHTDYKSYMNIYRKLRPFKRLLVKIIGK